MSLDAPTEGLNLSPEALANVTPQVESTPVAAPVASEQPVVSSPDLASASIPSTPAAPSLDELRIENERLKLRLESSTPYAEFGRQMLPYGNDFQRYLQSLQPQPAKVEEPPPPASTWTVQAPDAAQIRTWYVQETQPDGTTAIKPRPGTPPELIRQVEEYRERIDEHWESLRKNPVEYLDKKLGFATKADLDRAVKEARESGERKAQELYEARAREARSLEILNARKSMLFDAQMRPTAYGQQYAQMVQVLERQWPNATPDEIDDWAAARLDAEAYRQSKLAQNRDAVVRSQNGLPAQPLPLPPQVSTAPARTAPMVDPSAGRLGNAPIKLRDMLSVAGFGPNGTPIVSAIN